MQINRRKFGVVVGMSVIASACGDIPFPAEPTHGSTNPADPPAAPADSTTLLAKIQAQGFNVSTKSYGSGVALVINGETSYNFRVDGNLIGVGSGGGPTLNLSNFPVPASAVVSIARV